MPEVSRLKKLVVLALLLGGAHVVYRHFQRAVPIGEYEKFADAWAQGDTEEALRHADGDAIRRTLRSQSIRGLMQIPMMEAFHGTRYEIDSVASSPPGDVLVVARQTIGFDPPGMSTAVGGAAFAVFRHKASLHKTSEGWRVIAFEPTFVESGETRRR